MLGAGLQARALRDLVLEDRIGRLLLDAGPARLEQRLPETLELFVLGVQPAQIRIGLLSHGQPIQYLSRISDRRRLIPDAAQGQGIDAPAARVSRILERGKSQFGLSLAERVGRGLSRSELWQIEGLGFEAPVVGLVDLDDDSLGFAVQAVGGSPQAGTAALAIEHFGGVDVVLV